MPVHSIVCETEAPAHKNKFSTIIKHPFNGPFSGITQVSRYQKRKTNVDFTETRDGE